MTNDDLDLQKLKAELKIIIVIGMSVFTAICGALVVLAKLF